MSFHNHEVREVLKTAGVPITSEAIASLLGITHHQAAATCMSLEQKGHVRRIFIARDKPLLWEAVGAVGAKSPALCGVYDAATDAFLTARATQKGGQITKRDYAELEKLIEALQLFRAHCQRREEE